MDAAGFVIGPHTVDTDTTLDLTAIKALGFVDGAHTVNTDTQLNQAGVIALGFATGAHTVDTDTQRTDASILTVVDAAGFVTGPHTVDTDTTRSDAEILAAVGPHTVDTNTQRTDAEILTVVDAAGFVTGPHAGASVLDPYVTVDTGTLNGLAGPHILITGANVHVRDGSGDTEGLVNGKGNLIVGYNEANTAPSDDTLSRGGSHNLVVGRLHQYPNFGGLVAGRDNNITGFDASVSGGVSNTASGGISSVSGGSGNTANSDGSSVSGGDSNTASGFISSVSGGTSNVASGSRASVGGGDSLTASTAFEFLPGDTTRSDAEIVSVVDTAGYVTGPHTVDTDTTLDQAGIEALGFVTGPHTVDTTLDQAGIEALGFVTGPHAAASALDPYVTVDTGTLNGLAGPNIIFSGASVHVRDGSGDTFGVVNGLGNLVIGYNEANTSPTDDALSRGGSHNLVVGRHHQYTSFGGLIAGLNNNVTDTEATVSGGGEQHRQRRALQRERGREQHGQRQSRQRERGLRQRSQRRLLQRERGRGQHRQRRHLQRERGPV